MYRKPTPPKTTIVRESSEDGETLEQKIDRIINNKEPITDGAPIIYTERKDGVLPAYDARADKWDLAIDATGARTKSKLLEREERLKNLNKTDEGQEDTGTSEPTSK